uniref:Uncharacterized protein n=1 Tax=Entomoneis paludosa TaxID=265537 RepID=A0A7S2Y5Z0_9STRA|mmetsp:Transcript_12429/g.25766  ORF Transcript_12429/g.25766 Transcript_12429/m.25766 type:complete len:624 (+) Transcript_12429:63-1934(+)
MASKANWFSRRLRPGRGGRNGAGSPAAAGPGDDSLCLLNMQDLSDVPSNKEDDHENMILTEDTSNIGLAPTFSSSSGEEEDPEYSSSLIDGEENWLESRRTVRVPTPISLPMDELNEDQQYEEGRYQEDEEVDADMPTIVPSSPPRSSSPVQGSPLRFSPVRGSPPRNSPARLSPPGKGPIRSGPAPALRSIPARKSPVLRKSPAPALRSSPARKSPVLHSNGYARISPTVGGSPARSTISEQSSGILETRESPQDPSGIVSSEPKNDELSQKEARELANSILLVKQQITEREISKIKKSNSDSDESNREKRKSKYSDGRRSSRKKSARIPKLAPPREIILPAPIQVSDDSSGSESLPEEEMPKIEPTRKKQSSSERNASKHPPPQDDESEESSEQPEGHSLPEVLLYDFRLMGLSELCTQCYMGNMEAKDKKRAPASRTRDKAKIKRTKSSSRIPHSGSSKKSTKQTSENERIGENVTSEDSTEGSEETNSKGRKMYLVSVLQDSEAIDEEHQEHEDSTASENMEAAPKPTALASSFKKANDGRTKLRVRFAPLPIDVLNANRRGPRRGIYPTKPKPDITEDLLFPILDLSFLAENAADNLMSLDEYSSDGSSVDSDEQTYQ